MKKIYTKARHLRIMFLFLFIFILGRPVFAQQSIIIRGAVISEQDAAPLPGVTVSIKGTSRGTTTNAKGTYSIEVPDAEGSLVFSYVGYKPKEVPINGRRKIDVTMELSVSALDQLVVVGYGKQKKANLTGAVSSVDVAKVLGDRPVSTLGVLMDGVAPGLQVETNSGAPGAASDFNIRGATDIPPSGSGNTISTKGPLILVDNVPFNGPITMIDPNEIATISVLKDAGSAAIYGGRSAFGVILITTKKGLKNQKPKFAYRNNITFSTPMSLPEKASPIQAIQSYIDMGTTAYWSGQDPKTWLGLLKEYNANPKSYPDGYAVVDGLRYQLAPTNAFEDLLGKYALQDEHHFSVSGGSDKTTYRLSLGAVKENGILVPETHKDYFRRYNIKSVVTSEVTSWLNVQVDASYRNSKRSYPGSDGLSSAVSAPSYTPLDDSLVINGVSVINGTPKNAVVQSAPSIDQYNDTRITGRAVLKPVEGLTITGEYTLDYLHRLSTDYNKEVMNVYTPLFNVHSTGTGVFKKLNASTNYNALNVYANYWKSFEDHHFSLMMGFNEEGNSYEEEWMQNNMMIDADLPSISQATGILTGKDNYSQYALQGYFGRFNYNYKGIYLLEINGRYDASSKFPEGHRAAFFPSFSAGWNIMEEDFMQGIKSWFNQFKLRASLGSVGNQNISPYQFVPGMSSSYAQWLNDGSRVITLQSPDLVSSTFTWETVKTLDFGVDFGLIKNKLTGTFDWYKRETKNMLYKGVQLPAVLGTGAPLQNVASLSSEGYELQFNWKDHIGKVRYHVGINLYDFQSRITKIQNQAGLLSQYYVGQRLGEIWGYVTDRLYAADDFEKGSLSDNLTDGTLKPGTTKVQGELPNPGDVMYKDLDGDGVITPGSSTLSDPGDRRIIGNDAPRYQYGVLGDISWKNFSFSFVINGVGKCDQWLANILTFPNYNEFGTIYTSQLNYWTPSHTDSYYARMYDQAAGNQKFNERVQTRYLYNGAYLKIKNLTLSYAFAPRLLKAIHLDKLVIFYSMENVATLDHLPKGLEADIVGASSAVFGYPYMRMSSFGVNLSF